MALRSWALAFMALGLAQAQAQVEAFPSASDVSSNLIARSLHASIQSPTSNAEAQLDSKSTIQDDGVYPKVFGSATVSQSRMERRSPTQRQSPDLAEDRWTREALRSQSDTPGHLRKSPVSANAPPGRFSETVLQGQSVKSKTNREYEAPLRQLYMTATRHCEIAQRMHFKMPTPAKGQGSPAWWDALDEESDHVVDTWAEFRQALDSDRRKLEFGTLSPQEIHAIDQRVARDWHTMAQLLTKLLKDSQRVIPQSFTRSVIV